MYAVTIHNTDYDGYTAPVYLLETEEGAKNFSKKLWEEQMKKDYEYIDQSCSSFNEDTGCGVIVSYSSGETVEYGISEVEDLRNVPASAETEQEDPDLKIYAIRVGNVYARTFIVPSCKKEVGFAVKLTQKVADTYLVKAKSLDEAINTADDTYEYGVYSFRIGDISDTYCEASPYADPGGIATFTQKDTCEWLEGEAGTLEEAINIVLYDSSAELDDRDYECTEIVQSEDANPDGTATQSQIENCARLY